MANIRVDRKTDQNLAGLIRDIKKIGIEKKSAFWKRIGEELSRPTRNRRIVNLSKLDRVTNDNEIIIVPGKVLGTGILSHKLTIAAWSFSDNAIGKIEQAKSKAISIRELMKEPVEGKRIRIIG